MSSFENRGLRTSLIPSSVSHEYSQQVELAKSKITTFIEKAKDITLIRIHEEKGVLVVSVLRDLFDRRLFDFLVKDMTEEFSALIFKEKPLADDYEWPQM